MVIRLRYSDVAGDVETNALVVMNGLLRIEGFRVLLSCVAQARPVVGMLLTVRWPRLGIFSEKFALQL